MLNATIFKDYSFFNVFKNVLRIQDIFNVRRNISNKTPSSLNVLIVIIKRIGNMIDMILDV